MKRYVIVLLAAVFVMVLLHAVDAECNTYTTVYSYYRTPDPNSHAWISVNSRMNGLSAYDPVSAGTEGRFLTAPYTPGSEPGTLQKAYDTIDQWADYLDRPLQWRTLYSERKFESPSSVAFTTGFCPSGGLCDRIIYAYPAQNPWVNVSGYAEAGNLKVGGETSASATGNRNPPVAKATEIMSIKNSFILNPGTSQKSSGAISRLTVRFHLDGQLRADIKAYSHMDAIFNIAAGGSQSNILSVTGDATLNNDLGGLLGHGTATTPNGTSNLSYSTNIGTNVANTSNIVTSIYTYTTDLLTLYFDALVGTTYDVTLALNLLSEAYGDGVSLTNFWNLFGASIISSDGTFVSWDIPPPMKGDLDGNGLVDLADAILALKIMAGMNPGGILVNYVSSGVDVNNDNKIGMAEVIYILQKVAGVR